MSILTILSILATTFIFTTKANAETTDSTQNPNIAKAMDIQAKCMASTGRPCIVDKETLEIKDDLISSTTKNNVAENLPRKFDLRNCDIYNQGVKKNYVTSVKIKVFLYLAGPLRK